MSTEKVQPLSEWGVDLLSYNGYRTAQLGADARRTLRGRSLACWCRLDAPCHADLWLEVANEELDRCSRCGRPVPACDEAGSTDETNRPGRAPLCRGCTDGELSDVFDLEKLEPLAANEP